MADKEKFSFELSLSVLNHLGRNLYRSFATVLGEAISNAWDADADNVWIFIDKDSDSFLIKDDGVGMTADDFQDKFLKIGYSKRKEGASKSAKNRPYIGRKGIGKLALLSCAEKVTVITKVAGADYVGGGIDNSGLDAAITKDLMPEEYPLEEWSAAKFAPHTEGHQQGTLIYFEKIKEGIRNNLPYLKKVVALYFRFSLLDKSFQIYLNDEKIDHEALSDLAGKTEFLWMINAYSDPYIEGLRKRFTKEDNEEGKFTLEKSVKGFIASVEKPKDLKVMGTEERVGVDLFVNGRLRERDILKHIPTARLAESYLYGQLHFDDLDDETDRFTSSREGVVADDPKYKDFLDFIRKEIILKIIEEWDYWRIKHKEDGDPEGEILTPRQRKSRELYNLVSEDYNLPKDSEHRKKVKEWVDALADDAEFNFSSYAECFISENLIRNYIDEKSIALSKEAEGQAAKWKKTEVESKEKGNVSIDIRQRDNDAGYLSMGELANLVDKRDPIKEACLARDAYEYKPIRDAVAHTALLTNVAKTRLTSVYENIKGRVRTLLEEKA